MFLPFQKRIIIVINKNGKKIFFLYYFSLYNKWTPAGHSRTTDIEVSLQLGHSAQQSNKNEALQLSVYYILS